MDAPSHHRTPAMGGISATPHQPSMRRPSRNMQQYQGHVTAQQALLAARHAQERQRHLETIQNATYQPSVTPRPFISRNGRPATPRALALTPTVAPHSSPAQPNRVPLLRYTSALNAQIAHQWNPCWRPSSGAAGVPLTDQEQIPHVIRLFTAFLDTSLVLDSMDAAQHFVAGGAWMRDSADVELVSWNLVQACMSLHVVGAVTLRARRMPSALPPADSSNSVIPFGLRLFFLEVLVRHFKQYAHQLMCGTADVEQQLMWMHSCLFKKEQFTKVMQRVFTPEQREKLVAEFQRRKAEASAASEAAGRSVQTTRFVREEAGRSPMLRQGRGAEAGEPPQQQPSQLLMPRAATTVKTTQFVQEQPAHPPTTQGPRPLTPPQPDHSPATIRAPTPSPPQQPPSDPQQSAPAQPTESARQPPLMEFDFDDWVMFPATG
ncbi:hypothetical protein PSPO01_03283 [Paraphaeosphaeria sporulosa]